MTTENGFFCAMLGKLLREYADTSTDKGLKQKSLQMRCATNASKIRTHKGLVEHHRG